MLADAINEKLKVVYVIQVKGIGYSNNETECKIFWEDEKEFDNVNDAIDYAVFQSHRHWRIISRTDTLLYKMNDYQG